MNFNLSLRVWIWETTKICLQTGAQAAAAALVLPNWTWKAALTLFGTTAAIAFFNRLSQSPLPSITSQDTVSVTTTSTSSQK
jgi:hypothetical protein